ncbi:MarC family protein [Marinobacteraceae bacterium S3BR75-40.1]
MLEFGLLCFTTLFAMINPFGIAPVFQPMTHDMTRQRARQVAGMASLTALGLLVFFAVAGSFIFEVFGVSVSSLKIVGGVIFFMLGQELLQAKLSKMKVDSTQDVEALGKDIAITPLAIPIVCGPGAIANVIIFMHDAQGIQQVSALFAAIVAVIAINYLGLIGASRMLGLLGDSGNKVMMRIMGLIVMVIAVEFFISGLKPVVHDMLAGA